jgi:hypothetical protein
MKFHSPVLWPAHGRAAFAANVPTADRRNSLEPMRQSSASRGAKARRDSERRARPEDGRCGSAPLVEKGIRPFINSGLFKKMSLFIRLRSFIRFVIGGIAIN